MKGKRTLWTRLADISFAIGRRGPLFWQLFWQMRVLVWALRHVKARWFDGRVWIDMGSEMSDEMGGDSVPPLPFSAEAELQVCWQRLRWVMERLWVQSQMRELRLRLEVQRLQLLLEVQELLHQLEVERLRERERLVDAFVDGLITGGELDEALGDLDIRY